MCTEDDESFAWEKSYGSSAFVEDAVSGYKELCWIGFLAEFSINLPDTMKFEESNTPPQKYLKPFGGLVLKIAAVLKIFTKFLEFQ